MGMRSRVESKVGWGLGPRARLARVAGCRLLLAACLLLPLASWSQETRIIDGKKFTVHRVEQGQTLFAIARSYAVPVDELIKANPEAQAGIGIGQELLVPQAAVIRKEARNAPLLLKDGELRHTVGKKETLFGIAKRYGTDINVLLERNPEAVGGLREGAVIIVPAPAVQSTADPALRRAEPMHTIDHVVQPGETLFSLGQRFNVKPEAIVAANNGLPDGLKAGSTILIPRLGPAPEPPKPPATVVVTSALRRIGLLLPFSTARNDSALDASAAATDGPRFHEASRIAAQFYGGALIALDSLAALGLNAEVKPIDVGDEARQWGSALKDPAIADLDLCIGPFHRAAIEQLARANPRLPIVCPVPQSNKVVLGFPNVSKAVPARTDLVRHAARWLAAKHARDNLIVLRPEITSDKEIQEPMINTLNSALANQSGRPRDSVLVMRTGRRDLGELAAKLDPARLNVIVVPSEDVEFATTVVVKLKALAAKHSVRLVGMESWLRMDPIAATDLDALGFTYAAANHFDATDPGTQRFIARFRERFQHDVDEYAMLGFDVTFHFARALMLHGRIDAEAPVSEQPLHAGYRMSRTGPENGLRNEYGVMLQVKDLKVEKAQ